MRQAWDQQHEYLREARLTRGPKSWLMRALAALSARLGFAFARMASTA